MAVAEGGDAMTDRPLPWFGAGQDPGPSFSELLARTMPEARRDTHGPEAASVGGGHEHVPHGTTIIAIHYAEGVVMAGDRRATSGLQIAGRRMEKLQAADSHSGVAIAGAAGPAMELVRLFQTELEHYEKIEGMPLSLDGKANHLARLIRGNLPAAMQGFVATLLGRRRYFPQLAKGGQPSHTQLRARAEREAVNSPIQGSAADIIKLAMIQLPEALRSAKLKASMLLQVHDELVFEVPTPQLKKTAKVVQAVMQSAYKLKVPLKTDAKAGPNWEQMEPIA